jgi:hypothetical protein
MGSEASTAEWMAQVYVPLLDCAFHITTCTSLHASTFSVSTELMMITLRGTYQVIRSNDALDIAEE